MTVNQLKEKLNLKLLVGEMGLSREATGCYIGDLLSWVMGRASDGDVWLTVMGNVNAVAVATLADVACIVLTENAALDEEAAQKAEAQGVAILQTEENSFQLAMKLAECL